MAKPTRSSTLCLHIWPSSDLPKSVTKVSRAVWGPQVLPGSCKPCSFLLPPRPGKAKVAVESASRKGVKDSSSVLWKGEQSEDLQHLFFFV